MTAMPLPKRLFRPSPIGACLAGALAALVLTLPSCQWDGHFTIPVVNYTTRPNYDCNIRTVRVPIFENLTVWRGLEFELTRAVVREIEQRTPYKVVSAEDAADTELSGRIINYQKLLVNRTQLNEIREAETLLSVELVWRDLRTGEVLSQPRRDPNLPPLPPPEPGAPKPPVPPVLVQSIANFIPELGESITTARQRNVNRLAVQVVSMMEIPW